MSLSEEIQGSELLYTHISFKILHAYKFQDLDSIINQNVLNAVDICKRPE